MTDIRQHLLPYKLRGPLFRKAISPPELNKPNRPSSTRRPPGNVPYVVDNLWEWARPPAFPNRRHSVFACPDPDAIDLGEGSSSAISFQIQLYGACKVAQIELNDAKHHKDCKVLPRFLREILGKEWMSLPMDRKLEVGRLWIPCLAADEVDELFSHTLLRDYRSDVLARVTFWKDACLVREGEGFPYPRGEVFFEAEEWART